MIHYREYGPRRVEETRRRVGMSFSEALDLLKAGHQVRRKRWDTFAWLEYGCKSNDIWYFDSQNEVKWEPQQNELLCCDWETVNHE